MQRITRGGKTYVIREGRPIEIVSVDTGIDAKAIKAKRGQRLVAFPWAYLVDVCRLTEGRATLAIAALIYRRVHVCKSRTVTLPGTELKELRINRSVKRGALAQLGHANIIRIEKNMAGQTTNGKRPANHASYLSFAPEKLAR